MHVTVNLFHLGIFDDPAAYPELSLQPKRSLDADGSFREDPLLTSTFGFSEVRSAGPCRFRRIHLGLVRCHAQRRARLPRLGMNPFGEGDFFPAVTRHAAVLAIPSIPRLDSVQSNTLVSR